MPAGYVLAEIDCQPSIPIVEQMPYTGAEGVVHEEGDIRVKRMLL